MAPPPKRITDWDLERSLFDYLTGSLKLRPEQLLHRPGERFDERVEQWIEPRIASINYEAQGKQGEEFGRVTLQLRCFVKTGQQGGLFGALSKLADVAKDAVDSVRRVPAMKIRAEDQTVTGYLMFGASREARARDQTVTLEGVQVPWVDVATITVECELVGEVRR